MRALVVYESMFGNTKEVALAIAAGLAPFMPVEPVEVGEAPTVLADDVALLVVGAPTHQFGLSRPTSRQAAAKETERPLLSATSGLREWLAAVQGGTGRVAAATFTTQVTEPRWIHRFGSAARRAAGRLKRRGFRMVAAPESFYVKGMTGPLVAGEATRAATWGASLADELTPWLHRIKTEVAT